jgi:undecaprenyl-diphosphatase
MTIAEAIIIAVVEGITEFLPISSTGHMIITQAVLQLPSTDFTKAFIVNIQFGAILSVVVLYWRRFIKSFGFYATLFVAFIPAAVFGFIFGALIDRLLENVPVVAITLIAGGIILLYVDQWFHGGQQQAVSLKAAFIIGLFQCLAMVPGVSRSAATIIGGMTQGLNRKEAAEFSFFLAVPTMFAAAAYKLVKTYGSITADHIGILLLGNAVAFIVALLAIRGFITYLTDHGFRVFGYYRIIVGMTILILMACGADLTIH